MNFYRFDYLTKLDWWEILREKSIALQEMLLPAWLNCLTKFNYLVKLEVLALDSNS
jgi:hypothetical protein